MAHITPEGLRHPPVFLGKFLRFADGDLVPIWLFACRANVAFVWGGGLERSGHRCSATSALSSPRDFSIEVVGLSSSLCNFAPSIIYVENMISDLTVGWGCISCSVDDNNRK